VPATRCATDKSNAYFDGRPIRGADATSFDVLDGGLSKDSTAVYWTDGDVLSDDPSPPSSVQRTPSARTTGKLSSPTQSRGDELQ